MIRRIFSYWHQGFHNAPPIVRMCARSLLNHHPDWDVVLLDRETVTSWLEPIPIPHSKWEGMPLAHQSDIIRTQLLLRHGGVWADATVWFRCALDNWIDTKLGSGLFMFARPGVDRLISNWFIASVPSNPLLMKLYLSLCCYWSQNDFRTIGTSNSLLVRALRKILNRNTRWPQFWLNERVIRAIAHAPYMVYHYMFASLIRTDPDCRLVWENMPRVSARYPHRLLRIGLMNRVNCEVNELLHSDGMPLFKLSWKIPEAQRLDNSILSELERLTDSTSVRANQAR